MKLLVVGGSGMVGTFLTPYLCARHSIRVLDVRPPTADNVEYCEGSITDPDALERALDGVDAFVNLVMRNPERGRTTEQNRNQIRDNYEVNTLGLHLLLWTASQLGVHKGVHTSTVSVHDRDRTYFLGEELVPLDSPSVYGFTKGLGEHICQYFCRWFGMSIVALRITGPRARAEYLAERREPTPRHLKVTDEEDLARAYLAALDVVGMGRKRFDAVWIAGDEQEVEFNLTKARRLLDWAPRSQRLLAD